ncbi:MAG: thioredoxin domain-containing protein, partial [Candidatus Rokuibacteriota bacterium]
GRARAALFAHREGRIKPGRDEKVLAGWNGMMLRAFAEASRALDRPDYLRVAERNAGFLLSALVRDGRLLRTWKDGRAKLLGYLEDHAMVVDGLLALHEASLEPRWLDAARRLTAAMLDLFWDPQAEGFFDTGRDHETLVVRPRGLFDSAVPCGSSVAADVLLRLAVLTGSADLERRAGETIRSVAPLMSRYPSGFGRFLAALDFHLGPAVEVAVVWPSEDPPAQREALAAPLLGEVFRRYLPNRVLVGGAEGTGADLALLAGKRARGRPTAYVCERYACQAPTTEPGQLGSQLDAAGGRTAPAAGR